MRSFIFSLGCLLLLLPAFTMTVSATDPTGWEMMTSGSFLGTPTGVNPGNVQYAIGAASQRVGTLDLTWQDGINNKMQTKWYGSSGWNTGWYTTTVDNLACDNPTSLVSHKDGKLDVVAKKSADNTLWVASWTETPVNQWYDYYQIGGTETATTYPAITSRMAGNLEVIYVSWMDLKRLTYNNTTGWGLATTIAAAFRDNPAACSWGEDRLDIFGTGADYYLHHVYWDGATWAEETVPGGSTIYGSPAVVSRFPGTLDVIYRRDSNRHLVTRSWDRWSGSWSGETVIESASGQTGVSTGGQPSAVSWSPYRIDCFELYKFVSDGTIQACQLTWNSPAPSITVITPDTGLPGTARVIGINGTNFYPGSIVQVGTTNVTTRFDCPTRLNATIPGSFPPGTYSVRVINPDDGYAGDKYSAAGTYTVQDYPVPVVTSISPKKKTAGSPTFKLTINGNSFVPDSTVQWRGVNRTTTYVSPTKLTAKIRAKDVKKSGRYGVTVTNPAPGGGVSNIRKFQVY